MSNTEKLNALLVDVFLVKPSDIRMDLRRDQVDSWDSLGVVALEVGLKETFSVNVTPEESATLKSVQDIVNLLTSKGIDFSL